MPREDPWGDGEQHKGSATGRDRASFALQALVGYSVKAQVSDGRNYEGVFHGAQLDGPRAGFTLKMSRLTAGTPTGSEAGDAGLPPNWSRTLHLPLADVVQVTATDVRLGADDLGGLNAGDELAGFGTDAAISRGRGGKAGRELQRWAPSMDDAPLEGGLEDPAHTGRSGAWDQFAANRSKFGVQTSFQEDLYTTKLDKTKARISEAEAARLAAEIMTDTRSGTMHSAHVAEERGLEVDDGGMDEEDRYSSVLRQPAQPSGNGAAAAQPIPIGNGVPSAGGAWSNANSSIAAIAGRPAPGPGSAAAASGPRPIPGRTAAIDVPVDPRREHNKVAMQMATSPYGTPKGARSPLSSSPLVHNAAGIEALNLNPGVARVDSQTRAAFEEFKAREAAEKAKRERDELKEKLRTFGFDGKGAPSISGSASASDIVSPSEQSTVLAELGTPGAATNPGSGQATPAAAGERRGTPENGASAKKDTPSLPPTPGSATSSKLNPFAKSFTFNPSAKEFKPGAPCALSSSSVPAVPALAKPRGVPGGGGGSSGGARPPHPAAAAGPGNPLSRQSAPLPRAGSMHSRSGSGSGLPLPHQMMAGMVAHQRMGSGGVQLPPGGPHPPHPSHLHPGMPPPGAPYGPPDLAASSDMQRTGSGPRPVPGPGMAMSMQGGAPVQMPQGMYMQQPMYGQQVMMPPGSPGHFVMYPGPPRPQFVNGVVMSPYGPMVAFPGPASPGGPPPAGMPRPGMYSGPPTQYGGPPMGGMPPPPGAMSPGGGLGPPPLSPPYHPGQVPPQGHPGGPPPHHMGGPPMGHISHSRSSSYGGAPGGSHPLPHDPLAPPHPQQPQDAGPR